MSGTSAEHPVTSLQVKKKKKQESETKHQPHPKTWDRSTCSSSTTAHAPSDQQPTIVGTHEIEMGEATPAK